MNKEISVIYFHGYGSSPQSDKALALAQRFCEVLTLEIPTTHDEAEAALEKYLDVYCQGANTLVFVGTSLGGYWASIMADRYGVPALLINPSCNPAATLAGRNDPLLTAEEVAKFKSLVGPDRSPKVVLLAKDDAVLDYRVAEQRFKGSAEVKLFETGGHRFNEINIISNNIVSLADTSFYL
jgi:predicted esterase YcpF (UPF0227 family)